MPEVSILSKDFGRDVHVYVTKLEGGNYYHGVMADGRLEWIKAVKESDAEPFFRCRAALAKEIGWALVKEFKLDEE